MQSSIKLPTLEQTSDETPKNDEPTINILTPSKNGYSTMNSRDSSPLTNKIQGALKKQLNQYEFIRANANQTINKIIEMKDNNTTLNSSTVIDQSAFNMP